MSHEEKDMSKNFEVIIIVHFVVTVIVLMIAAYFTPGFIIPGFWAIVLASVFIVLVDYFIEKTMGVDASSFGRGIKGFLITVVIFYLLQFIVQGMEVSIISAIVASIIIGILDVILPIKLL